VSYPSRIVCLTEETTETLYLLGEEHRIVGISGFTVRPKRARQEKPKVSAFTSADTAAILALSPDLVLGFSDLQADIASSLIKAGLPVYVLNHRSVDEILGMVLQVGGLVGAETRARALVADLTKRIDLAKEKAAALVKRPRVYFEEWGDPLITGIRWVSELVEIAGGIDVFPELRDKPLAKDRILADPSEVVRRAPDIIIGSWCGRKFHTDRVIAREGWDAIPAVRDGALFEIKSSLILQPGPAALTDGLDALTKIITGESRRGVSEERTL
jgi:iron complex transport system substrate-binding protein